MKKRQYSANEKVKIIRRVLEGNEKISEVADQLGINPNLIHRWKKELFEGAADVFAKTSKKQDDKTIKVQNLENEVKRKDQIIAFFAEENLSSRLSDITFYVP